MECTNASVSNKHSVSIDPPEACPWLTVTGLSLPASGGYLPKRAAFGAEMWYRGEEIVRTTPQICMSPEGKRKLGPGGLWGGIPPAMSR